MGWKIDWTQPALDDLANIVRYLAKNDPEIAQRVGDKIVDHVGALAQFPEIGPVYRRRPTADVRQILSFPYRIFYRLRAETSVVEILHVWHGARRAPSDL